MITRHHLALALTDALIISGAFLFSHPDWVILVTAGTCIGVLLPDIHITRPKHFKPRSFAWLIVQFSRQICAPLLCWIYAGLHHPVQNHPGDKRLTHSLPGTFFVFACTGTILLVPAYITGNPVVTGMVILFLAGILLGSFLHLIEDLCTRKGIFPGFPFSAMTITGSIRPCDKTDPRIGRYLLQHCAVLLIIFGLVAAGILSFLWIIVLSFTGLLFCQIIMIGFSEVSIHPKKPKNDKLPTSGTQGIIIHTPR